MSHSNGRTPILIAMMFLLLIAIFTIGFLLVPESSRGGKFWISIGGLVVSVVFCFAYPAMMSGRMAPSRSNLPLQLVPSTLGAVYLVLNMLIAVLATTAISFNLLVTIHIFTFVGLLLLLGGVGLSSIYFNEIDIKDKAQAAPKLLINQRLLSIRDRLDMIEVVAMLPLKGEFKRFYEEQFQYAASETVSGAEAYDIDLNQCLDQFEECVGQFEGMVVSETLNTDDGSFKNALLAAQRILKRLGQSLERREQLVGELRNAAVRSSQIYIKPAQKGLPR